MWTGHREPRRSVSPGGFLVSSHRCGPWETCDRTPQECSSRHLPLGVARLPLFARGLGLLRWPSSSRYALGGVVKEVAGTRRARRSCGWSVDRGWASGRWFPTLITLTAATVVSSMTAVGFWVSFLSPPGHGFPVVSTWSRSVRSLRRHRRSASHQMKPSASLRSGVFRNSLLTMTGSCKTATFCSTPCGAWAARRTSPAR